jgi:hypothetical protein
MDRGEDLVEVTQMDLVASTSHDGLVNMTCPKG